MLTLIHTSGCYTDGRSAYLMDDFGNAVLLAPLGATIVQWAMFLVDGCLRDLAH